MDSPVEPTHKRPAEVASRLALCQQPLRVLERPGWLDANSWAGWERATETERRPKEGSSCKIIVLRKAITTTELIGTLLRSLAGRFVARPAWPSRLAEQRGQAREISKQERRVNKQTNRFSWRPDRKNKFPTKLQRPSYFRASACGQRRQPGSPLRSRYNE